MSQPGNSVSLDSADLELRDLREEVEELRRATRLKDQCLGVATHELSAPLAAMKAYIDALIENYGDASFTRGPEFLLVLKRETSRLIRVVESTLEISKITSRGMTIRREALQLPEIIDEVSQSLRPVLAGREMSLDVQLASGLPAVQADRDLLKQVFINLIHNAVKFSKQNSKVYVSAVQTPHGLEMQVRDEGFGIVPDELEQVFEPYFRSADRRVARQRGTGLGLTIVKTIIEQHGGRVRVESEPNRGTTFRFSLPVS